VLTRNKLHEFEVNFFSQISAQAIVTHKQLKFNSGVWYPCKPHVGSSAEAEWSLNPSNFIQCCHMRISLPSINTMCSSSWFYLILSKLWLSPQKIMLSAFSILFLSFSFLFSCFGLVFSFHFWFCLSFIVPLSSWFPCCSPSPLGFVELASINAWVFLLLLVLSQKLRRLVNVWYWSPPTVGSWWS